MTDTRTRVVWDYAPAPESPDHVRLHDSYGLFIGGEFRDPVDGTRVPSINPATEEPVAEVAFAGPQDIRTAVETARAAQPAWAALSGLERGIRDVAPEAGEAADAFGATRRQVLVKVKIPLAGDAIMLGVNQGIIMVLAVVVIGGLVGSGGLGYEVAQGLVRGQFGQGVVASIAILALGIALDRVTQGARRGKKEELA